MNVLIVGPSVGLEYTGNEAAAIIDLMRKATPLIGRVTRKDFFEAVLGENYDLVWFITHTNQDGIHLSDGVLDIDHLAQFLQRSKPAVILNTCESERIAVSIHNITNKPVVFTISNIEDEEAAEFGILMATALGRDRLTLTQAYELSIPPYNSKYFMVGKSSETKTQLDKLEELMLLNRRNLTLFQVEANGKFDNLDARAERLEEDRDMFRRRTEWTKTKIAAWVVSYLTYSVLFLLAILEIRFFLHLHIAEFVILWLVVIVFIFFLSIDFMRIRDQFM